MLDIVQILRRNRFLVFAENARREILQSPPLCLPGFADRPAEGLRIRCHCHYLGNSYTRISVTTGGIRVKKSLVFDACRPALGPEGTAEPIFVRGHGGDPAPLGPWPNARLAKEAAKTAVVAFAVVEFAPVIKSSVPETLKKYPCFAEECSQFLQRRENTITDGKVDRT